MLNLIKAATCRSISDSTRSIQRFFVDFDGLSWRPGPSSLWRSFICSLHRGQFYSGFHGEERRRIPWETSGWKLPAAAASCQERGERKKEAKAPEHLDMYDSSEESWIG